MDHNRVLGMICGYYLSRFDREAYLHLGYENRRETHRRLSEALGVPSASIKNWRDEFDPIHLNPRQGWHNREMKQSRKRAVEALASLSENELLEIVRNVLAAPRGSFADQVVQAVSPGGTELDERGYGLRGPTGARAEEAFRTYHAATGLPVPGELLDRRNDECGFDFEVRAPERTFAVEVKGRAGNSGGILFTDKEWRTARDLRDEYFLVVVSQVESRPAFSIFRDPVGRLDARLRAYTTVQLGWSVSGASLRPHVDPFSKQPA